MSTCFAVQVQKSVAIRTQISANVALNDSGGFTVVMVTAHGSGWHWVTFRLTPLTYVSKYTG